MTQCITMEYVGRDVHKDSIVIVVAEEGRTPGRVVGTVPYDMKTLRKVVDKLGPHPSVSCCYEAGPTGYGLARSLKAAGWACEVIAPYWVPKNSGERIKSDRPDAVTLVAEVGGF